MPYHFEFDATNGIAQALMEGHVSAQELGQFYKEAQAMAERLDPRRGVLDLTGVTSFEVSFQTVREIAKMRPVIPDTSRPRVIIVNAALLFEMARFFESEGQGTRPNLHVVRNHREAWAILGVHEPQFARAAAD